MRPSKSFRHGLVILCLAPLGLSLASCATSAAGPTGGGAPAAGEGGGGADPGGGGSGNTGGELGLAGAGGSGSNGSTCNQLPFNNLCPGLLADKAFRTAVCACGGGAVLVNTDSYDSVSDPTPLKWGAPVGVNGYAIFGTQEPTELGGSLIVTEDINVWSMKVHGDIRVGGPVSVFAEAPFQLDVLNDAWVGAKLTGAVKITHDLYQTPGVVNGPQVSVAGMSHPVTVDVSDPCPCSGDKLIDIPAIVGSGVAANDDSAIGTDAGALASVSADTDLQLDCGNYYFSGVQVTSGATLTLHVNAKVVLLVDGHFGADVGSKIVADIAPAGELDLFVLGQFGTPYSQGPPTENIVLGSKDRAAAVRVYVWSPTSDEGISLGGTFVGNLYAPNVSVVAGGVEVYGSLLMGGANLNHVTVHYDRAMLGVGDHCENGPTSCNSCGDCTAAQACVDGTCGACTQDSDCCPPLVCLGGGQCGALIK